MKNYIRTGSLVAICFLSFDLLVSFISSTYIASPGKLILITSLIILTKLLDKPRIRYKR